MGYTKLFRELVTSSVWRREDDSTRLIWITMLALRDADHVVRCSIPGLSDMARVTDEQTVAALAALMSADPMSRTKEHEGRRIAEVDGGWMILNGEKYMMLESKEHRRVYLARKQRELRARKRELDVPEWKARRSAKSKAGEYGDE